ncbi:DUF222 domain-containing protein [Nocardia sp. NPDC052566]|uniref:HNH endonuclease signature motif containing protein n=1 Tax=Nocardia sp. NPDC052566 TaxID=3364330 RepID=UPI0037C89F34
MVSALEHRLYVEVSDRSIPARVGAGTLKRFLIETLNLSNAEAGGRVAATTQLGAFHDMHGRLGEPRMPATAAAQAEGAISVEHACTIGKVLRRIPGCTDHPEYEAAESVLAGHAREMGPEQVARIGEHILGYLNPDGSDVSVRQAVRGLRIGSQRLDKMSVIHGEITPELRALLEPVIAKLGRPGMNNPDDPESPRGNSDSVDAEVLKAAAKRDTRSAAQRGHDAVLALLQHGMSPDSLGSHRGLPVSAIVTMRLEDLEAEAGVATTATGGTVPIAEAIAMVAKAKPYLAIIDSRGMPLHFAQGKRLASAGQRLALIAALRGCSRPGCTAPASISAAHHVRDYAKDGPTDIENLTLACDHCHGLIHDGPGGWKTIVLGKDSKYPGRTGWIAPPHIDPEQRPRVNHHHHPGELLAETLARDPPP